MIKDIEIIEKELIDHVEIEFPYENIKLNIHLKYITHKNDCEYFFKGGKLIHICNDYLTLQNKGPKWNVPINIRDKKGDIIYKSRFFVNENEFNQNDNNINDNNNDNDEIIKYQQSIINKISEELKKIQNENSQLYNKNVNYEELLQKNRYELKDLSIKLKDTKNKLLKYELYYK